MALMSSSPMPESIASLTTPKPAAKVPASLETFKEVLSYVTNDLDSVVQTQHPIIATLKSRLRELGADAALMSGSGSTVFGLYSQQIERDSALKVLASEYPEMWVHGAEVGSSPRPRAKMSLSEAHLCSGLHL